MVLVWPQKMADMHLSVFGEEARREVDQVAASVCQSSLASLPHIRARPS